MYVKTAYIRSISTTPVVILNDPSEIGSPVHSRMPGMSFSWMVWPDEYSRVSARKILNVPSVTMNGGRRNRVTRRPFRPPARVPTTNPSTSAAGPGRPKLEALAAITIEVKTMIEPMDRSIPAVRMMIVWPTASAPTTATCWKISDRFAGSKKRGFRRPNRTEARIRTTSGLIAG
jgi:hypothetical protein